MLLNCRALPDSKLHEGFPTVSGILKDEAIALLRRFYDSDNPRVEDSKKRRKKKAQQAVEAEAAGTVDVSTDA